MPPPPPPKKKIWGHGPPMLVTHSIVRECFADFKIIVEVARDETHESKTENRAGTKQMQKETEQSRGKDETEARQRQEKSRSERQKQRQSDAEAETDERQSEVKAKTGIVLSDECENVRAGSRWRSPPL